MRALLVATMVLGANFAARAAPPGPLPELFRSVAAGQASVRDLVDPDLGVALVDLFKGPSSAEPTAPKLLCGAELDAKIDAWQRAIRDDAATRAVAQTAVPCAKRFGGTACTLGAAGEWDPAVHYVFVPRAGGGLRLRAIVIDDEVLVEASEVASVHRAADKTLAVLAKKTCALPKAEVKVLKTGSAPKVLLRLTPARDMTQAAMMTMAIALEMDLGGQKVPVVLPPMKMGMSTNVTNVSNAGDIAFTFKVDSATVEDGSSAEEVVVAAMKGVIGKVVGMGGDSVIDARGATKFARFVLPPDAPADVRQIVDGFQQSLVQMSIPLPKEAVGPGAVWQAKVKIEQNGMTIDQAATFELVSIEGGVLKLKFTFKQTAPAQVINSPDMPAGATAKLLRLQGGGHGEATYDLARVLPVTTTSQMTTAMWMTVDVGGQTQDVSMKMSLDVRFEPGATGAVSP